MDERKLLTIALELLAERSETAAPNDLANLVGSPVVIRTVTYHYLGRLADVQPDFLVLEDASWLADSGRWGEFLAHGNPSEVEPYPDPVMVSRGAVVDVTRYRHDLPTEAK